MPAMKSNALVPLGQLFATPTAILAVTEEEVQQALQRHVMGDWGELDEEDKKANDLALQTGERLLSAYKSATGTKFWIITEADRASTCVLLPEDY
jgi:hypothetical protein